MMKGNLTLKEKLIEHYGSSLFEHYDLLPQSLGIVDLKAQVVFVNKAFEKEFGLKRESVEGQSVFNFCVNDKHKREAEAFFEQMKSGRPLQGTLTDIKVNWQTLKNGEEIIGFLFIVNQINQGQKNVPLKHHKANRKSTKESLTQDLLKSNFELKYTKKLLELVLQNAKIGIWKYNFKTQVSQYDKVCQQIFGFDPSYPGAKIRWKERVVDEFKGYITNSVMSYTKGEIPEYDIQYQFRRLDGKIIWIKEKGEIVETDEKGSPKLLLGSVRDITPQKDFEELLIKAKEDAEKASQLKSELISNVNHELRTPLTIILGMTETIIISEEDEDKRRFLKQIYDSANRLLEMINDILDLSKLENKSIPIQKKKIDIKKFLYDYIAGIKIQADSQKLKTLAIIENDVPKTITVDKTKLMQILNNLFGNALKYTKKGEIGLRVSRNKNKIVFSIFDSGVGIPKKDLEKVFERFYQVDSSNRKKHKGTGLGLSIVKSLVEIMGGTISVYSSEGKGTCFKFSIPIT
ncbi:MAG: hypothetical protein PWQ84_659 [Thermotogaceae bacterium]|nr:hypothetical protein [Thermotogaceae bacterium]